jgi:hypothetical protein
MRRLFRFSGQTAEWAFTGFVGLAVALMAIGAKVKA